MTTFNNIGKSMEVGRYVSSLTGRAYVVKSVYRHNEHIIGSVEMSNPATGHGWAGEMTATRWTDLCSMDRITAR